MIHSVTPKPCPCCGGTDLSIGHVHAIVVGIECLGCNLQMVRQLPSRWPRGYIKKYPSMDVRMTKMKELYLNRAITAWNKRPK